MKSPTTILLIGSTDGVSRGLPGEFATIEARTLGEGLARLRTNPIDIVLLDLEGAEGLRGLYQVRSLAPDVPVITLTAGRNEDAAVASLAAGASDYLLKGDTSVDLLSRSVRGALAAPRPGATPASDRAPYDAATCLPSRMLFNDRLTVAFRQHRRNPSRSFAVLAIDIDGGADAENRTAPAGAGSRAQRIECGKHLRALLRAGDTVVRLYDAVYGALLTDVLDATQAVQAADRIQRSLRSGLPARDGVHLPATVGIALSGSGYRRSLDMVRDAVLAMSRAQSQQPPPPVRPPILPSRATAPPAARAEHAPAQDGIGIGANPS